MSPSALPDVRFEGFGPEAFDVLDGLRRHPHIARYREERDRIRTFLQKPFQRFRDDLVVNWVLPRGLGGWYETEKNVFSRLLKNDFGAGGCHHHLWMAFYRSGRKRLTDIQLSHSISPDGFCTGLYVGDNAAELLARSVERIAARPETFLGLLDALLRKDFRFFLYTGSGKNTTRAVWTEPLAALPARLEQATGLWIRRSLDQETVLALRGGLVSRTIDTLDELWPLYRFLVEEPIGAHPDSPHLP